uniref:NADH dehydrogenase subunit 6 n=1 Tax=Trioza erytreae TaxID=1778831 RepID=A0A6M8YJN7_TRIEB|nr:NADH dehydrogenase subunit 6 [Trioza erytreae]
MLKMFLSIMMISSIWMSTLTSPVTMGFMLLLQSIISCIIMREMLYSSWIPFTTFLMIVSGLMIVFTYVTSICSNNKFKLINFKPFMYSMLVIFMLFKFNVYLIYNDNFQLNDHSYTEFFKLYIAMNIFSSFFMFIYLLIILLIMINLMNSNKAPMRKKY